MKIDDWDAAYSNRLAVANSAAHIAAWQTQGQAFRAARPGQFDIAYGQHPREVLDIYSPPGTPGGTLIFVHGGYWRACSKDDHGQFAEGALARGWRVVVLDYPLCPEVSMAAIADSVRRGIEFAARQCAGGPIVLAGHSAGGQLVTQAVSRRGALTPASRERIARVVSLSGIHDLRPLLAAHELNTVLGLDGQQAVALSPVLDEPGHAFELFCACGGGELSEFRRQNALLASLWLGAGIATEHFEVPGRHHFDLVDELKSPDSRLTKLLTLAE